MPAIVTNLVSACNLQLVFWLAVRLLPFHKEHTHTGETPTWYVAKTLVAQIGRNFHFETQAPKKIHMKLFV